MQAIRHGTPVLVMMGTGRVANLLADMTCILERETRAMREDGLFMMQGGRMLLGDDLDMDTLSKYVLVHRVIKGLQSISDVGEGNQTAELAPMWKQLFRTYVFPTDKDLENEKAQNLWRLVGELAYIAGARGWVYVYDIKSVAAWTPMQEDSSVLIDVVAQCMEQVLWRTGLARTCLRAWRKLSSENEKKFGNVKERREQWKRDKGSTKNEEKEDKDDVILRRTVEMLREADRAFRLEELLLLVRWDRIRMLRSVLSDSKGMIGRDMLNITLHAALQLGRADAAEALLAAGADTSLYTEAPPETGGTASSCDISSDQLRGPSSLAKLKNAWGDLVLSILADDYEAPYIRRLFENDDLEGKQGVQHQRAVAPLSHACRQILPFDFELEQQSAEFKLFLLMLLANRGHLARIIWKAHGQENAEVELQEALLACVLCRRLAERPEVLDRDHARDCLLQTAEWFEEFATRVLVLAHRMSREKILRWMVSRRRPIIFAPKTTAIELVVEGR